MNDQLKVNFGSGHWRLDGWINVDIDPSCRPEVCADLVHGLPFRDASIDLMNAEDFMDQVSIEGGERFLRECHRALKPGGVLRLLTPDLEKLSRLYRDDPEELKRLWREDVGIELRTGTAGEIFNLGMRLLGHRFVYDAETLRALCADCGFDARPVTYNQSDVKALRGLDLRAPDTSVSMYFDCYRISDPE